MTYPEEKKDTTVLDAQDIAAAHAAADAEGAMGFKEGGAVINGEMAERSKALCWPGIVFSCLLSFALVMEGFDLSLINSYFGHPAFKEKFGVVNAQGVKEIPADWQSGLGNVTNVGAVIGL